MKPEHNVNVGGALQRGNDSYQAHGMKIRRADHASHIEELTDGILRSQDPACFPGIPSPVAPGPHTSNGGYPRTS